MIHPTPTKVLLTTTFESLVRQLSGSLAVACGSWSSFSTTSPRPRR